MAQRYTCFGKRLDRSLTPEELDLDDVPPLPSGIKLRLGPVLPQEESEDAITDDDDDAITEMLEQLDDEVGDDGQCMADFFPENEIDSMTSSVANEVCTEDDGTVRVFAYMLTGNAEQVSMKWAFLRNE